MFQRLFLSPSSGIRVVSAVFKWYSALSIIKHIGELEERHDAGPVTSNMNPDD
jgi:hypothetical protein